MDRDPRIWRQGFGLPAMLLVGLATVVAYANSLSNPFLFDDGHAILHNADLARLSLAPIFGARGGIYLTFLVNRAIHGSSVAGYHLVNVGIHIASAMMVFLVVRRALDLLSGEGRPRVSGTTFAFATALLWAVHPLQTQSITYVVQRCESLTGLMLLVVLYSFIRGAVEGSGREAGDGI